MCRSSSSPRSASRRRTRITRRPPPPLAARNPIPAKRIPPLVGVAALTAHGGEVVAAGGLAADGAQFVLLQPGTAVAPAHEGVFFTQIKTLYAHSCLPASPRIRRLRPAAANSMRPSYRRQPQELRLRGKFQYTAVAARTTAPLATESCSYDNICFICNDPVRWM
jgi:hypothetical protein